MQDSRRPPRLHKGPDAAKRKPIPRQQRKLPYVVGFTNRGAVESGRVSGAVSLAAIERRNRDGEAPRECRFECWTHHVAPRFAGRRGMEVVARAHTAFGSDRERLAQ